MNSFKIIAFTHTSLKIKEVGKTQIDECALEETGNTLLNLNGLSEVMYLATCNRTEFLLNYTYKIDKKFLQRFFRIVYPGWNESEIKWALEHVSYYSGEEAVRHIFAVASSLDSLVVGEREIITQVRNAYEKCKQLKLTGDTIRLLINKTIECAKEIYSGTNIARNPVSVVSLADRKLKELDVSLNARFLILGSGVTNASMSKYLKKHGFTNFTIFNRTLSKGKELATELDAQSFSLDELKSYNQGFDVIVTCMGSCENYISSALYKSLVGDDAGMKVVIDLAVPNNFDVDILNDHEVNLIAINNLKEIAAKNLEEREKEMASCGSILESFVQDFKSEYKERQIEVAMSAVPFKVKEICESARNEIYVREIEMLDDQSKAVIDKVISYLERKFTGVPMKMAKEILLR